MARINNYLWLIVVTIICLIMHSFGGTLEGISRSTAINLILLNHYQKQVATYGGRVDETLRLQFIDKCKHLIKDHDTAVEILNHTEKDWLYTLHLASKSKDINMDLMVTPHTEYCSEKVEAYLTDSIVTLHAKLLAMYYVVLYLEGIFYYTMIPGPVLYDIKYVANHLLVFIYQGTDELLQSMIRVFDSLSLADESNIIKKIREGLEETKSFHLHTKYFITKVESLLRSQSVGIQQIEIITRTWYSGTRLFKTLMCRQQEYFISKFALGTLDDAVQHESVVGPIQNADEIKLFWSKTENINKYFIKQLFNDPNKDAEYTMADVIRANVIDGAEISKVCRRNIVERFEIMIPEKFKIFIHNNMISNNANLKNNNYY